MKKILFGAVCVILSAITTGVQAQIIKDYSDAELEV